MARTTRILVPGAVLALLLLGAAPPARLRHNHLVKSKPGAGEVLATPPTHVELWFAERPEIAFTSITLTGADSTKVQVGKAVAGADTLSVRIPVIGRLRFGVYNVAWRTASKDGHAVRGQFGFRVGQ